MYFRFLKYHFLDTHSLYICELNVSRSVYSYFIRHIGGSTDTTPKRTRNNGGETVALIAKKMELDQATRREEEDKETRRVKGYKCSNTG